MKLVLIKSGFGQQQVLVDDVEAVVVLTNENYPVVLASNFDGRVFVKNATEEEFSKCLKAVGYKYDFTPPTVAKIN